MKLISLSIGERYKSLEEGFKIVFRDSDTDAWNEFGPMCFAGSNGSGKSNVLEALANIFYHLELCANRFKPESFYEFFDPAVSQQGPDDYRLTYKWDMRSEPRPDFDALIGIQIVKSKGQVPKMYTLGFHEEHLEFQQLEISLVAEGTEQSARGKDLLPDLVVGYSSGENETLSHPFLKTRLIQFDEYKEASIRGYTDYEEPESSLLYIDPEMSQAVLLVNMIFQTEESLTAMKRLLKIDRLLHFRITLHDHVFEEGEEEPIRILALLSDRIELLKKCATAHYSFVNEDQVEVTYLDFFLDDVCKQAFKKYFHGPEELFRLYHDSCYPQQFHSYP